MSKPQRKLSDKYSFEREENSRHHYKIQKNLQNKKMMKNLDKALRNKDFVQLTRSEDY